MKKDLMKTNCYDVEENMIIIGSCIEQMFPEIYRNLEKMSGNIYDICLEQTHLNMAITKIIGMITRKKVKKIMFVTVDKSPHCIQLHYIVKELEKVINLNTINIENYVATEKGLEYIPIEIISISKNLSKLKDVLATK